ncbi:MAG TPA: metal-dependent hydrolase, partial [Aliiroseovarius sp.]|nr:metal-dependent hydrolase [Aliiroseovarius sp.]
MNIIWLGHSGFRIEIADQVLLVDPWLTGNPMFDESRRAEAIQGVTHILVTHGHSDHTGDALAISAETGAPIAGIYDLMSLWEARENANVIGFNKGGTIGLGAVRVTMVNAVHSSSMAGADGPVPVGAEAGFMIAGEGRVIYLTGDTDIMADMEWMGNLHKPDIG